MYLGYLFNRNPPYLIKYGSIPDARTTETETETFVGKSAIFRWRGGGKKREKKREKREKEREKKRKKKEKKKRKKRKKKRKEEKKEEEKIGRKTRKGDNEAYYSYQK